MRKIITCILYGIALTSLILATGVKEVANWWEIAKPLLLVFVISAFLALTISNIDNIRRVTYPSFVCLCAYLYKNKIIMTRFTRNSYRLYKFKNRSYCDLYDYVQDLFDLFCKISI